MVEKKADETLHGHTQDKSLVEWQQYHHNMENWKAKGNLLSQRTYIGTAKAFKQKLQAARIKDTIQSDCNKEYKIFVWHLLY